MMPYAEINYAAVFVCAVLQMALGALYYSPAGLGKAWMRLTGRAGIDSEKCAPSSTAKTYALMAALSLLTMYVLAHFEFYTGAQTAPEGALIAFWLWLGFTIPAGAALVCFEGRSWTLFALNAAYPLVSLAVAGAILAVWI